MAYSRKDFPHKVATGLWCNDAATVFYYDFKVDSSRIRGTLDYTGKNWSMAMKTSVAKAHIQKVKDEKKELLANDLVKFDLFINRYFNKLKKTDWVKTKINHYNKYIKEFLGSKRVRSIKKADIETILEAQKKLNLKPRTLKTTLEVLSPVFKKAIENGIITKNPCSGIKIEIESKKEVILDPEKKLQQIVQTLYKVFEDDPYYLSLYLFAMQGRTKGEILKIRWEFIDFDNNLYRVKENGKSYLLQPNVKEQLSKFKKPYGWVYESTHNLGRPISNIEKQTIKIKEFIPKFTIRYMQDIVKEVQERQVMGLFSPPVVQAQESFVEKSQEIEKPKKLKVKPKLAIGKFSK